MPNFGSSKIAVSVVACNFTIFSRSNLRLLTSQLRILFYAPWYPNRLHPTLGNFVHHHARALAEVHHVTVLNIRFDHHAKKQFEWETHTLDGVHVQHLFIKPGISKAISFKKALKTAWNELDIQQNFDLLHFNILSESWPAILWMSKYYKKPMLLTEHWSGYNPERGVKLRFGKKVLMQRAASKLSIITTVTQQLAQNMALLGMGKHFKVVPNVVDTHIFFPEKVKTSRPFSFLHVSTLDENKNPKGIINAFGNMKNSQCWLMIGGDGDLEPLKLLVSGLPESVRNRITIFGMKTHAEVADLMKQSDALVLFSQYENFPCVIAEAWASGIPIISTAVGGIAEFTDDAHGILLYNNNNDASLTNAMERMASNQYDAQAIRQYALGHFSHEAVRVEFEKIYGSLLNHR